MELPLANHLHLPPPEPPPVAPVGGQGGGGSGSGETLLVVLLIGLIVVSVVGNTLVCVAIFTDRRLRKLGNAFIVSLAIADLFVSCLVMTFALVNDLMNYWIFGDWFCDVWISFDIMCCTASILNLCAISLDRFIHIKDCLLYNQWMTKRVALGAVVIIWFISALVSFVPITLGWHKPDYFTSTPPPLPANKPATPLSTVAPFSVANEALERLAESLERHEHQLREHQVGRAARQPREANILSADDEHQFELRFAPPDRRDKLNYSLAAGHELPPPPRRPEVGPLTAGEDRSSSSISSIGDKLAVATSWSSRLEGATSAGDNGPSGGGARLAGGQRAAESANKRLGGKRQIGGQTDFVTPSPSVSVAEGTSAEWKRRRRRRRHGDSAELADSSADVATAAAAAAGEHQSNQVEFNPQDGFPIGPDPASRGAARLEAGGAEETGEGAASDRSPQNRPTQRVPDAGRQLTTLAPDASTTAARANGTSPAEGAGQVASLPQCMLTLTPTYAIISSTISFYIPCIIMLGLYTKLFACARKHVRNIQAISKAPVPIASSQPATTSDTASLTRQPSMGVAAANSCNMDRKGRSWRPAAPRTWIRFGSRRAAGEAASQVAPAMTTILNDAQAANEDNRAAGEANTAGPTGSGGALATTTTPTTTQNRATGGQAAAGEPSEADALLVEGQPSKLSRQATSFTSQKSNSSFRQQAGGKHHVQYQQQQQQQQSGQLATHKAAVTLGIIMGSFLFCWVPFFCLNITKAVCVDCIPSSVFRFFTWLGYANSALNPIIYGIHNTEFRNAFNRIFFKHLNIKSSRHYLNRRFSYDLRHASNRTTSRKSCSQQATFNPTTNAPMLDNGTNKAAQQPQQQQQQPNLTANCHSRSSDTIT